MSHSNISIFVPHFGCKNQCTFCNQRYITGQTSKVSAEDVDNAVKIALSSKAFSSETGEIAFFGGSFTAIDRDYMLELLAAANKYVKNGSVAGIRISTRPDCITDEILELLGRFGVTAIELGAQSMCDSVLEANKRGHHSSDVVHAAKLIKKFGFELGLQMMTGLYKSSISEDLYTAEKIIELSPDTVRIYPTITIKNTELEQLFNIGEYQPQKLEDAVELCAELLDLFDKHNIKVIRLGLHSIDDGAYIAGPWHPSFRELCESFRFRRRLEDIITQKGSYIVFVSRYDLSKAIGQKRSNVEYFMHKGIKLKFIISDSLNYFDFKVEEVKE